MPKTILNLRIKDWELIYFFGFLCHDKQLNQKKHYDLICVKVYGDNEGESYSDANDDDPRTIQQSKHNQILLFTIVLVLFM